MTHKNAKPVTPVLPMPVRAKPYSHQIEAFNLAMRLFGMAKDAEKGTENQDKETNGGNK